MKALKGQGTAEFAMIAVVLFGLLLGVIDLGRAGFMQHNLDAAAADMARSLTTLTGASSSGNISAYVPTPLDLSNVVTAASVQADLVHAVQVANGAFSATPLAAAGAMTLTNSEVTVVATPNITAPVEITVTITAPFTPVVGVYLTHSVLHLSARAAAITPLGQ